MKGILLAGLAALTLATACKKDDPAAPAASTTMQLSGSFSSANQVPAVTTPSSATGSATGTFDTNTKLLTYSLSFTGLTDAPLYGHFHFGDAKHKGPVVISFSNVPAATSGTITGSTPLTQAQADSLMAGRIYANIHTPKNTGGEIRANVIVK